MYEESAISIFRKLPETKEQVKKYSELIKSSVLNGEVNPLTFAAQVTALEQLFKSLKDDILIKDRILEEAEKYASKSFEYGNAKFNIREVGVKYDYAGCNDFEYESICNEISKLAEKKKQREEFLKTIKPDIEVFGSDGVQLNMAAKTSSTQVVVLLK